jgi:hypothetical protein
MPDRGICFPERVSTPPSEAWLSDCLVSVVWRKQLVLPIRRQAGSPSPKPGAPQLRFEILRDPLLVPLARKELDAHLRRDLGRA